MRNKAYDFYPHGTDYAVSASPGLQLENSALDVLADGQKLGHIQKNLLPVGKSKSNRIYIFFQKIDRNRSFIKKTEIVTAILNAWFCFCSSEQKQNQAVNSAVHFLFTCAVFSLLHLSVCIQASAQHVTILLVEVVFVLERRKRCRNTNLNGLLCKLWENCNRVETSKTCSLCNIM